MIISNSITIFLLLIIILSIVLYGNTLDESFISNLELKIVNTYVVNLDKDKQRMDELKLGLNREKIKFERFSAIYGKDLDLSSPKCDKYFTEKAKKELKLGQMGCSMSHITIWEKIAKHPVDTDVFMVLEDDAIVPNHFHRDLVKYTRELPYNWDMLLLGANNLIGKKYSQRLLYTDKSIKKNGNYGLYAYLLKPRTAKKMLKTCEKMDKTIDHYLNKNFYLKNKVYFCNPHFVTHNYDYESNLVNRIRTADAKRNNQIKII